MKKGDKIIGNNEFVLELNPIKYKTVEAFHQMLVVKVNAWYSNRAMPQVTRFLKRNNKMRLILGDIK